MRLKTGRPRAAPIDGDAFAAAMAGFAPFEPRPLIAAGVSGGPDSMALILLLDAWARARSGSVLALTVDHGLRAESEVEARQVGAWLARRCISHVILNWEGAKPPSGIQQAARQARYRLLTEACAARGILHLAVAHHQDDQAETILFRRERGSGPDGLAGMAALRSLGLVELLRPLLGWPKEALVATCGAFDQSFVDDPSNRAEHYARTALRRRLAADDAGRAGLLEDARRAGDMRAARDGDLAALLGRSAEPRPDGAIVLDPALFVAAKGEMRCAALAAALRATGGGAYPPDKEAVERLDRSAWAEGFRGASLAGCMVRPWRRRLLIVREPGRIGPAQPLAPNRWQHWDGRFLVRLAQPAPADEGFDIGALGRAEYASLRRRIGARLPALIATSLPAIWRGARLVAVPGFGWAEADAPVVEQRLAPLWSLSPEKFTVVYADARIICDREDPETA